MSLRGQKLGPCSWLQALTPAAGLGYSGSLICTLPITKPMHLDTKKVLFRDGALVMVWPGSESQGRGFPGFFPWPGWGRLQPCGMQGGTGKLVHPWVTLRPSRSQGRAVWLLSPGYCGPSSCSGVK